jgi:transposase InsO family protein
MIRQFHEASDGTYGAPRILADLREPGIRISRKRVARLMCEAGLVGVSRRKGVRTT